MSLGFKRLIKYRDFLVPVDCVRHELCISINPKQGQKLILFYCILYCIGYCVGFIAVNKQRDTIFTAPLPVFVLCSTIRWYIVIQGDRTSIPQPLTFKVILMAT